MPAVWGHVSNYILPVYVAQRERIYSTVCQFLWKAQSTDNLRNSLEKKPDPQKKKVVCFFLDID